MAAPFVRPVSASRRQNLRVASDIGEVPETHTELTAKRAEILELNLQAPARALLRLEWKAFDVADLGLEVVLQNRRLRAGRFMNMGLAAGLSAAEIGRKGDLTAQWKWSVIPGRTGLVKFTINEYSRPEGDAGPALVRRHIFDVTVLPSVHRESPDDWLLEHGGRFMVLSSCLPRQALEYSARYLLNSQTGDEPLTVRYGRMGSNAVSFAAPNSDGITYVLHRDETGGVNVFDVAGEKSFAIEPGPEPLANAAFARDFFNDRVLHTVSTGRSITLEGGSREDALASLLRTMLWAKPRESAMAFRLHLLRPLTRKISEAVLSDEVIHQTSGQVLHRNATTGRLTELTPGMAERPAGDWLAQLAGPGPDAGGLSL